MEEKGIDIEPSWQEATVIAESVNEQERFVANVVKLLDSGATLPFIARYRKEQTGDMAVEKLREITTMLQELREVVSKMRNAFSVVKSQGKMTKDLEISFCHARTVEEVELLFAPFKPGHKGSLAERAKALGLETTASEILNGRMVAFQKLIKAGEKGLSTVEEVESGVQHIIADTIAKDKDVMEKIRKIYSRSYIVIETKQFHASKGTGKKAKDKVGSKLQKKTESRSVKNDVKKEPMDSSYKFEQYFDWSCPLRNIKSHQILAINRGEDKKVLTVKVNIPDGVKVEFSHFAHYRFIGPYFPPQCKLLIEKSIEDSYERLIQPQLCRHIRSEQTKLAEKASILVFSSNLRRLLLTPPVKGKIVLGIDPGFRNGCKTAIVSPTGEILHTQVFYFHDFNKKNMELGKCVELVKTHRCDVIAIGNGKACRETELLVADLIQRNVFVPCNISYCIVDEGGSAIYSVSVEAQKELPHLDPTLRGAVSIARRLQDPLSELVKIEPKNIGVGMYQHDVTKTKLHEALESVVEECVSFVGVDLNTASQCLLRRIAGLSAAKAKKIIEYRIQNGYFMSRSQLMNVKGLGEKSFNQCAGFVRVTSCLLPENTSTENEKASTSNASGKKRKAAAGGKGIRSKKAKLNGDMERNALDMTAVHPESYTAALRFLEDLGLEADHIGQESFISVIKQSISTATDMTTLAEKYGVGAPTMKFIMEALSRPVNYDFRSEFQTPLFKKGTTSVTDLKIGQQLTGRVTNVTDFGAFVDIGVGINGLIHVSKMRPPLKPNQSLGLGDRVEVIVLSVEQVKNRIGLKLQQCLNS